MKKDPSSSSESAPARDESAALKDILEFAEEEIEEKTGRRFKIPVDKKGADILFIHNAGEFIAWPENLEAFAIILDAAGVDWTLSTEIAGYDSVNYGVWYDDFQFARVAIRQSLAQNRSGSGRSRWGNAATPTRRESSSPTASLQAISSSPGRVASLCWRRS